MKYESRILVKGNLIEEDLAKVEQDPEQDLIVFWPTAAATPTCLRGRCQHKASI